MTALFLEDLSVGQSAELTRTVAADDLVAFAAVTGDDNPVHLDEDFAKTTSFGGRIAHGMLSAGYISAVIGTKLPGSGAIYLEQTLRFRRPVRIGDEVTARAEVTAIDAERARITLATTCRVSGKVVVEGEATIMVPGVRDDGPMKVLHGWKNLPPEDKGASVAHGNFDGVHIGHQRVIADAAERAAALGVPLGVISFEPHARMHFEPDAPPFRVMNPRQLARTLAGMGVDILYLLPFGAEMAAFSDRDFVAEVLVAGLGVRHVAIGFDVTFGKGRTGDPDSMRRYGEEFGFTVSVTEKVEDGDGKISSSAVRDALRAGRPEVATAIMGRPFAIEGIVQKGRQLGRKLGFPTANVPLGDYVAPRFGVYATRTRLNDGRERGGVANIGVNPTTGVVDPRLEVWLFDFDEDIYGESIETDLIEFLRPEETFRDAAGQFDVPAMVEQVHRDAARAKAILARTPG